MEPAHHLLPTEIMTVLSHPFSCRLIQGRVGEAQMKSHNMNERKEPPMAMKNDKALSSQLIL
jgi:hypothetical protein